MTSVENKQVKESKFSKVWQVILKGLKIFKEEFITYPLYIMAHPIKGFDEFKRDKKGYSKELARFREFCSNRRSGSEIHDLFFKELDKYIEVFDFKVIRI